MKRYKDKEKQYLKDNYAKVPNKELAVILNRTHHAIRDYGSEWGLNKLNDGKFKKGQIGWNKGKTFSDKHKERMSMAQKGHEVSEVTRKKIRIARATQIVPVKDTKIEVKIQDYLKKLGVDFFTHQYIKDIKHSYQCDVFIPSINLVIECDGDYWHKYPVGKDIDHVRTKELIEKGFKVLRLWEREIKVMSIDDFKKIIWGK